MKFDNKNGAACKHVIAIEAAVLFILKINSGLGGMKVK
jgi:hypothetical protein